MFTILFLGDIVGRVGRRLLRDQLSDLKSKHRPDLVIVNGENAAGGLGIDPSTAEEIFRAGVDLISTGNHVWSKKEIQAYLEKNASRIIRPYNYPAGAPGAGVCTWKSPCGRKVALINLLGRVFIPDLVDCPFRAADTVLSAEAKDADIVLVDFHAEATSEKVAMGYHLDGRVSVLLGTHTHVQTADARILPQGTAYLTDVGMCGPYNGVIGVNAENIVERFLTALPMRFDVAKGPSQINGVVIRFENEDGKASEIERIYEVY